MDINISSVVSDMLKQYPKTRDDDFLLILRVWIVQLGNTINDDMKKCFRVLLDSYHNKKISSFESIRRSRQKLQEENTELRGQKYWSRQEQAELFRQEIKRS